MYDFQLPYARPAAEVASWVGPGGGRPGLAQTVAHVQPTILIGTSTQTGAFTEAIVRDMAAHTERPIIMPLSNPTSQCEALPADLIDWTEGRALIATGSPFAPVPHEERRYQIAQANNALVFPGLGLGVTVARASRITNGMIAAAADAVAAHVQRHHPRRAAAAADERPAHGVRGGGHRGGQGGGRRGAGPGADHQPDPAGAGRHVAARVPEDRGRRGLIRLADRGGVVLRVLIVEDQAAAAEVMAAYVERVPGFEVAGQAASGADCLRQLGAGGVDLILLDIHLPDMSGLEVLRRIRAAGSTVDVIVVTQARDLSVVQAAVSFGSMQYLIKPFTFAAVRQKLERYQEYRSMLTENNLVLVQQEVDRLLHTLRDPVGERPAQGHQPGVAAGGGVRAAQPDDGRGGGRRAVRGRGGQRVRLLPGDRPALPGVPGHARAWRCAARATAAPGVPRSSTGWCRASARASPCA